jgi:hypothetical protein
MIHFVYDLVSQCLEYEELGIGDMIWEILLGAYV